MWGGRGQLWCAKPAGASMGTDGCLVGRKHSMPRRAGCQHHGGDGVGAQAWAGGHRGGGTGPVAGVERAPGERLCSGPRQSHVTLLSRDLPVHGAIRLQPPGCLTASTWSPQGPRALAR